jgi:hypothetical protein
MRLLLLADGIDNDVLKRHGEEQVKCSMEDNGRELHYGAVLVESRPRRQLVGGYY